MSEHLVTVAIGKQGIERWHGYSIDCDMLQPADAFELSFAGGRRDVWELVRTDGQVDVLIDDVPVLSGFIGRRSRRAGLQGSEISIAGRDRGGRMVDESMPLQSFEGLGIKELAEACSQGIFGSVALQNTRNRKLARGSRAKHAAVSGEPIITRGNARKKVDPGETRWQVLDYFLKEGELLAWSSCDGAELIVGLPNYRQDPQYRFFVPAEGSRRAREGNVIECEIVDQVEDRYARIVAMGAGKGNTSNYAERVVRQRGTALCNPDSVDGTGTDFLFRKDLILADDDVKDLETATRRARREMARRAAGGHSVRLKVRGHDQSFAGIPVLYAFDCMAEFEDEETGTKGSYLITRITFRQSLDEGETTAIEMVPKDTVLA